MKITAGLLFRFIFIKCVGGTTISAVIVIVVVLVVFAIAPAALARILRLATAIEIIDAVARVAFVMLRRKVCLVARLFYNIRRCCNILCVNIIISENTTNLCMQYTST